jgi:ketosteroid isomerase-like protein
VPTASPIEIVLQFERLINSRSPEAICGLLTEDSALIDSLGNRMAGIESLRKAWAGYFKMVPDYAISHAEIFADGGTVAVFGSAQGTFAKDGHLNKEDFWKTPAAWRAVVREGKIALWQVFADNEPIRAIMRRYQSGSA